MPREFLCKVFDPADVLVLHAEQNLLGCSHPDLTGDLHRSAFRSNLIAIPLDSTDSTLAQNTVGSARIPGSETALEQLC